MLDDHFKFDNKAFKLDISTGKTVISALSMLHILARDLCGISNNAHDIKFSQKIL